MTEQQAVEQVRLAAALVKLQPSNENRDALNRAFRQWQDIVDDQERGR